MSAMQSIQELKQEYHGEWLALTVKKEGPDGPETGELLYHHPDVQKVWDKIEGDPRKIYVTFAGSLEGFAAAF